MSISIEEVKRKHEKLFAEINAILFDADPININYLSNTDEYHMEVVSILQSLQTVNSAQDVHLIVYEEFLHRFGVEITGSMEKYEYISTKIWNLWRSSLSSEL